jgi:hypothetical protein
MMKKEASDGSVERLRLILKGQGVIVVLEEVGGCCDAKQRKR